MIVTRNIGRLGNNLFQIAHSIGYAKKYGYQWAADIGNGLSEPYSAIHQVFPNLPKEHFGSGVRYHEHPNAYCNQHGTHYDQCHFDYHEIPDLGPNVSFSGFYQSYKYFENAKEEVRKVFELPHWVEYEDYVSIHVRRGDYVQHSGSFPPITIDYIIKAINELESRIGKWPKVIFFSDDIQWCKINFEPFGYVTEYSEGRNERQDIEIMASCKHHIICNSTFSWWGAYLGHNPDRIVISPSVDTWFGPTAGVKRPVIDLIPPNWIQIKTR